MPVEQYTPTNYFTINKEGDIRGSSKQVKDQVFQSIWGVLVGIDLKEDEWEGEKIFKYQFKLEDPAHGQLDILQVGEKSSAARGIIMSLTAMDGPIRQVRFSPFTKKAGSEGKTYTNVWVSQRDHQDQPWQDTPEWPKEMVEGMPEVETMIIGDQKVLNDWERRKYIRQMAAHLKKHRLNIRAHQSNDDLPDNVDPDTGEVMDGKQQGETLYGQKGQEHSRKVTQKSKELHRHDQEKSLSEWADEQEDDLLF